MKYISTPYGNISTTLFDKIKQIKLLISDVDGVLSDGNIYLTNNGDEIKSFNAKDGYGIVTLQSQTDIKFAVITGRKSEIVQKRMESLNVSLVYQGIKDKHIAIEDLKNKLNVSSSNIAYIGDDIPDLLVFNDIGLSFCPADAHPLVKNKCSYVSALKGGRGVVREVCDLLLLATGNLEYNGVSM